MGIRVGINGFGRIGRNFFRAQHALGSGHRGRRAERPRRREDDGAPAEVRLEPRAVRGRRWSSATASCAPPARRCKMLSERDPAALPWGDLGVEVVLESTGLLHRPRRRREAPRRRREEGRDLRARHRPGRHARPRRERRRVRPRVAPHRLERVLHDELRRAAREGAARARRDRVRLHDDDPRVHERPGHPRLPAQGPPPRARRGDQPHPDVHRRREGDRPRHARAPGEGGRHLGARAGRDRLAHRSRRPARPRDERRRGATTPTGRAADGPLDGILQYSEDPIVSTDINGSRRTRASTTAC